MVGCVSKGEKGILPLYLILMNLSNFLLVETLKEIPMRYGQEKDKAKVCRKGCLEGCWRALWAWILGEKTIE